MRRQPIVRHLHRSGTEEFLSFYHPAQATLRVHLNKAQRELYLKLKNTEQNSAQRLKIFLSQPLVQDLQHRFLIQRLNTDQVFYHFDKNQSLLSFIEPDKVIARVTLDEKGRQLYHELNNSEKSKKPNW